MMRTQIASIFLGFLTIVMLSTNVVQIHAWPTPKLDFNHYVEISQEQSDSEDTEKSSDDTDQENDEDSKTETKEEDSSTTEETEQEEDQPNTDLASESTTDSTTESSTTEETEQEEDQPNTDLASESTTDSTTDSSTTDSSTTESSTTESSTTEETEQEEDQPNTDLANNQSNTQESSSFNPPEQKPSQASTDSDKTDERLQVYLAETMKERYDQDLCRHHSGTWDFNSKQCQIQDPDKKKAYDKESKETSRYDQALCGNSGTWNDQNNICEINDLDVKTDFEDTLCDDSPDSVLYDTCNFERYKDNRSVQIKDYDRIQCTNFNGRWDDQKALCETDDAELQKYLNERHDIYSCITSGHEWNYQTKECETTHETIHTEDKKSVNQQSTNDYDIKVVLKNPDGLNTKRDATVKTKMDSATEKLHILKKTEITTFNDISGNPGKKVTVCIEGSKKIQGDCETKKLPYNDDSITIKLTIQSK